MFNLTRYFSIASLVCIVVAAAILGAVYRQVSVQSLMLMTEDRNACVRQRPVAPVHAAS